MSTAEALGSRLYPGRRTHRAIPSPQAITEDDVRAYREQGFIAVESVFSPDEVEDAKAGLTHLIMGGNPNFRGVSFEAGYETAGQDPEERERYVRKCMWFVEHDQRLAHMANHPTLHAIMRRLIGSEARLIQDMALLKPPHIGREKPWHQDTAYFLYEPLEQIIGTWTALDEATAENGCMHVIPGSHRLGPMPHYHDRDCQLPDDVIDVDSDVVVPLKPGGVLFFSGLIHHGTPPNQSSARRRAIQLHYAGADVHPIDARRHAELFHDDPDDPHYAGCVSHGGLRPVPIHERRF